MKPQVARLTLLTTATLVFLCSVNAFAQRGASLRGQVTDQFGAVIVGVAVTLTDTNGLDDECYRHAVAECLGLGPDAVDWSGAAHVTTGRQCDSRTSQDCRWYDDHDHGQSNVDY